MREDGGTEMMLAIKHNPLSTMMLVINHPPRQPLHHVQVMPSPASCTVTSTGKWMPGYNGHISTTSACHTLAFLMRSFPVLAPVMRNDCSNSRLKNPLKIEKQRKISQKQKNYENPIKISKNNEKT